MLENNPPQLQYLDSFQAVGGKVWPASELMVKYLTYANTPVNARILELGSGCGYVGIACAALGAKHVTLTDRTITQRNLVHDAEGMLLEEEMPPNRLLLDICGRNIKENSDAVGGGSMDVQEMQWGSEHGAHIDKILHNAGSSPYDLIIGSDVTYHAELSESLFWTVSELMKRLNCNNSSNCSSRSSSISSGGALSARESASGGGTAVDNNKLRFIVSHQHRLDSATALTLATAKQFGLHCTTLATSSSSFLQNSDVSSSNSAGSSIGGHHGSDVSIDTIKDTSNFSISNRVESTTAGEFVIWQFNL